MKKHIFPSLVIGIILFMWQFISWAAGNFHAGAQRYTPHQDTILKVLNSVNLEDGRYMMPSVAPEVPAAEAQKQWESFMGKPWVFVTYHQSHDMSMGMNMLRGLLVDILAGWFLVLLFGLIGPVGVLKSVAIAVGISLIGFFNVTYTNHIWYPTFDLMVSLLDAIVPFSIIGLLNARFWNKG